MPTLRAIAAKKYPKPPHWYGELAKHCPKLEELENGVTCRIEGESIAQTTG